MFYFTVSDLLICSTLYTCLEIKFSWSGYDFPLLFIISFLISSRWLDFNSTSILMFFKIFLRTSGTSYLPYFWIPKTCWSLAADIPNPSTILWDLIAYWAATILSRPFWFSWYDSDFYTIINLSTASDLFLDRSAWLNPRGKSKGRPKSSLLESWLFTKSSC
jgi:hypothetical protein